MTETEKKALALVNEVATPGHVYDLQNLAQSRPFKALLRAIEQHDAFRQEVSDAVESLLEWPSIRSQGILVSTLNRFILPKPDPLVEALLETFPRANGAEGMAADLRAALAARGGRIVWEGE